MQPPPRAVPPPGAPQRPMGPPPGSPMAHAVRPNPLPPRPVAGRVGPPPAAPGQGPRAWYTEPAVLGTIAVLIVVVILLVLLLSSI